MNDEQDNPIADEPRETEPRGGERLAEARRARQISVLEVAKELHLDEPKVRALERNDFDVLGAPVFAKGHLRKYARLVGVDETDIFADYYAMTRSSTLPPVVVGRPRIQQEFSPGPWIAALAVLGVAAGAYWWFVARDDAPETEPAQPAQIRPEQFQPEETAPLEPVAAGPQISLSLAFLGECWTEIIDADGRKLFFDMGNTGQSVSVRGTAPISALFGNVANVSVEVNGENYTLPAARNPNGTVRVTIVQP
ncbi:MAG: DUF4115 domain-containing protein [Proteobacteria bacterium]|nr:DUF4115 domain-containing protein [Pseudomonadota bacterium]